MTSLNKKHLLAGQQDLIELLVKSGTCTPTDTPTPTPSAEQGAREAEAAEAREEDVDHAVAIPIEILKLIASYCAVRCIVVSVRGGAQSVGAGKPFFSSLGGRLQAHLIYFLNLDSRSQMLYHKIVCTSN